MSLLIIDLIQNMKESYYFREIYDEIERKKTLKDVKPITAQEHESTSEKPMALKDYSLSLRQSIQEKVSSKEKEPLSELEQEKIKSLSELITPELMNEYKQIIGILSQKTRKTEQHPQRELINIDSKELSENIESWIEHLINEVRNRQEAGLGEEDIEELRAQCWLFFASVGCVMNTHSFERDIVDFYKTKDKEDLSEQEEAKQKKELLKDLQTRYSLNPVEAEILVNLIKSDKDGKENYSPKVLVKTISKLWGGYKLGEKKGTITKISLGYLISKGAESFAPSLFQNIIAQDKFNVAVFLEYFGLNKISEVIDAKIEIELAKVMNDINHQINERITNSLFFQEFEFIHEKSLGEIYETLERGKDATEQILHDVIARFTPTLAGIAMSLAFLAKINLALGAIGVASLPVMYKIAKKQNKQIWSMYEQERREGEKIARSLGSIKSGFEEVKTLSETPAIAHDVKKQMDTKDTLSLKRNVKEIKMRLQRIIPFDVSTVVAAGVGGALEQFGMISGGAVLSNIIYSNQLNWPVQELVNLYFNRFSRYIQDIQHMEDILGKYEELDLPEGEREKNRVPVTELENLDISIRNLCYKNILRGISLDIKQGEFLTITGASGIGKSTLLRNIVGLYHPDGGDIEIGGVKNDGIKKYGKDSLYSVMSYCNQSPQIFDGMTLRENLLLWSKEEVDDAKIKKVLEDLHLDKFVDKLDTEVKYLSGGEMVRIGVARTLIKGAKIILLDEPTASLDSQAATEVRKVIAEVNEKYPDTTIICASHDEGLIKISKRSVDITQLQKPL